MVLWSYPPTRQQMVITLCGVLGGVTLIAVGAYLSMANVEPQQARAKARKEYVKARLRQMLDD